MRGAVGLLTSCDIDAFVDKAVTYGEVAARCVATIGLSNALRAGDTPGAPARVGTINALCHVSTPLTPEAMIEAMALASEARALAVREADIPSRRSGEPSSGTGTDCIVIAAPDGDAATPYAGKHTAVGHVIGASVHDAIRDGVAQWQRRASRKRADGDGAHA
jgi:adenosylcobinamide amidohydrolase